MTDGEIRPINPAQGGAPIDAKGNLFPAVNNGEYSGFIHMISFGCAWRWRRSSDRSARSAGRRQQTVATDGIVISTPDAPPSKEQSKPRAASSPKPEPVEETPGEPMKPAPKPADARRKGAKPAPPPAAEPGKRPAKEPTNEDKERKLEDPFAN